MKAMILAAGRGERLRPITDSTPKPLVKVAGEPLIFHQIRKLKAAGINRLVINLHHLGAQIEQVLGTGDQFGVKIRYSHEANLLETGGGVVNALPLLGSDPFVILNGDIYTDFPFTDLPVKLASDTELHLVLTPKPDFREAGDFMYASGRVIARGDDYVYCGIAILRPEIFADIPVTRFSLRDIFFSAVRRGTVSAQVWRGYWTDIGNPEQLAAVNAAASHDPDDSSR
ncbi:MAG: nucleotidyltransferase family protein [Gammaproteobacteria bacterium]|nr:nucleotidyltransferase family protein [Gammaproteobacteria bacterium]